MRHAADVVPAPPRFRRPDRLFTREDLAGPARRVEQRIAEVLHDQSAQWTAVQPDLRVVFDALGRFVLAGGKRLRPSFCYWGAVGAGADPGDPVLVDACAALELLHAFALIHDDVMDGSTTRRGQPSVHDRFEDLHRAGALQGERRRFGEALAVLTGDLAFVYADTLVDDLPPRRGRCGTNCGSS